MKPEFMQERYKPFSVCIGDFFAVRFETVTFAQEFAQGFNKGMRMQDFEMPENRNNMLPFNRGFIFADSFKFFCAQHNILWKNMNGYITVLAYVR